MNRAAREDACLHDSIAHAAAPRIVCVERLRTREM
jgi:hypothetical protein